MIALKKHYLVEVPFITLGANRRYMFNDIHQLKDARIVAIEAHSTDSYQFAPSGRQCITAYANLSVSISCAGSDKKMEDICNIPYTALMGLPTINNNVMALFNGLVVDLSKSYVTMLDVTGFTANQCALFSFYYE